MELELPHFTMGHGVAGVLLGLAVWAFTKTPWRKSLKTVGFLDSVMERFDRMETSVGQSFAALQAQTVSTSELLRQHTELAKKQGELEGRQKTLEHDYNGIGQKLSRVDMAVKDLGTRVNFLEDEADGETPPIGSLVAPVKP
jgi:predicted nuclease with TOPRIM domain